jgi:predicted RNase H-like HicB family nuclease
VENGAMNIEVELEQESDGRWIADVPSIPGAIAYGATKKEALERVIAILKESGEKESTAAAELVAKQYANARDLADQ